MVSPLLAGRKVMVPAGLPIPSAVMCVTVTFISACSSSGMTCDWALIASCAIAVISMKAPVTPPCSAGSNGFPIRWSE